MNIFQDVSSIEFPQHIRGLAHYMMNVITKIKCPEMVLDSQRARCYTSFILQMQIYVNYTFRAIFGTRK